MVTHMAHLEKVLHHFVDSYNILKAFDDKPGDLDHIKKELLKVNGFLKVMTNKIESKNIPLSDFKALQVKFNYYLENYSFEKEIDTMSPLYFDDTHRIKNMRLKILEALENAHMMENVGDFLKKI